MNDGKDMNGARERKVIDHPHEPISRRSLVKCGGVSASAGSPERTSFALFGAHTGGLRLSHDWAADARFTAGSAMERAARPSWACSSMR